MYPKLEEHAICKFLSSYVLLGEIEEVQSACEALLKLPTAQLIIRESSNNTKTTIALLFTKLRKNHDLMEVSLFIFCLLE